MKKLLLFLICGILLIGTYGCANYEEDLLDEISPKQMLATVTTEIELADAVYHKETHSWMRPQNDPYRLENFQRAYDNIVSGESGLAKTSYALAENVQKEFAANAKKQQELKATHYALKIFPKTEEEQRSLELDEQIKIAYTPFNYTSLPDEVTQSLVFSKSRTQFCEEDEERRYSVTYEGGMIKDGPVEPVTIILPVLYAVWPVEKPFPVEMDFEILYEVFLPKYITLGENGLSAEAIQILEQEAIALALDEERHLPGGFPRGKVLCYDTHLKRMCRWRI